MKKLEKHQWREMVAHLWEHHTPICRQWFEKLEPASMDAGLLRIRTETGIQQNYLQKKCIDPFREAAQAVTGALVAVEFINGQASPPAAPPASSSSAIPSASLRRADTPTPQLPPMDAPRGEPFPRPDADATPTGVDPLAEDQMVLQPDYSFDNFIDGPNNALAHAASVAVANNPGRAYNPLFIYGGVGLGKTHLLQAICQQVLTANPAAHILFVSCDSFISQFIQCVQSGQMAQFRHRYRHVDMLVIDDIHFLAERERSQEEFFHTFNSLYQLNKQIVLSSDAAPSEIPNLEERLVSRFAWGMVAAVTKPSYETRQAILKAKSELRNMRLPREVIDFIARRIDSNARELEGAIATLQGHVSLNRGPITMDMARQALGEPAPVRTNQVTLQKIIDAVTAFYNVKLSDLQSRRRHKSVTEPRQVCMWLARKHTRFSLEEIGGHFGGRDHTTVMHSIRTVDGRSDTEPDYRRMVEQLDQQIASESGG